MRATTLLRTALVLTAACGEDAPGNAEQAWQCDCERSCTCTATFTLGMTQTTTRAQKLVCNPGDHLEGGVRCDEGSSCASVCAYDGYRGSNVVCHCMSVGGSCGYVSAE